MEVRHHQDRWRYVIVLSKTIYAFFHQGIFKSFGVMIPTIVAKFGCSYSVAGLISSIYFTLTHIMCPVSQHLTEKFSKQTIAIAGGFIFSLSISSVFFTQSPLFMGILLSLAGCGNSMIYQASHTVLKEHFGDQFGSMFALTSVGLGVGSIILPLLTYKLLNTYGLGGAFLILGGLTANTIPIGSTFRSPRVPWKVVDIGGGTEIEEKNENDAEGEGDVTSGGRATRTCCRPRKFSDVIVKTLALDALWKERQFACLMVPCQLLFDTIFTGWSLFVVSFAVSVGISPDHAPYLLIVGVVGGVFSRFMITMVLRLHPQWAATLYILFTLCISVALFLYYINTSFYYLTACSFIAGFGLYGADTSFYACVGANISEDNFAGVLGICFFFSGTAMAISGYMTGRLYDLTQSFKLVFQIYGGLGVLVVIFTLTFIYRRRTNASLR